MLTRKAGLENFEQARCRDCGPPSDRRGALQLPLRSWLKADFEDNLQRLEKKVVGSGHTSQKSNLSRKARRKKTTGMRGAVETGESGARGSQFRSTGREDHKTW